MSGPGLQLHTYVESRLHRWRVWLNTGSNPTPKRVISWWGPSVLDRNVEQTGQPHEVTVDVDEAVETDRTVRILPTDLREAVFEVWTKGGTMAQKAKALHITRDGLYKRLDRAYPALLGYFNDQAAGVPLPACEPLLRIA